jgi:hypothetical protein
MNSGIDWHRLRPLEGSQPKAFEELCAQLASAEVVANGRFVRKGSPDAGVECYWELPNKDLYAWQAKFFRSTPQESQWKQLDESVETALAKHKRLVRYTICIPLDRSDPIIPNSKWFMDQWDAHVEKWRQWSAEKNMQVQFEYWGQSELLTRLSTEQHAGRFYFWFKEELFSSEWFGRQLAVSLASAGQRYIPSLNVNLPVRECFRGLGRTAEFFQEFERLRGEIRRNSRYALHKDVEATHPQFVNALSGSVTKLLRQLGEIDPTAPSQIPLEGIRQCAREGYESAWKLSDFLRETEKQRVRSETSTATLRSLDSYRHYLYELQKALSLLGDLTERSESLLANTPAMLLIGNAGVGKTHLFCDVAVERQSRNRCSLVMLDADRQVLGFDL